MGVNEYYRRVVEVVCDLTELTEAEIVGKCRMREYVDARCLVMRLLHDAGYYPSQIARVMNISTRWVQKIIETFDDRLRFSADPMLRCNLEEATKILRRN